MLYSPNRDHLLLIFSYKGDKRAAHGNALEVGIDKHAP